jgi:hypothetical protein
VNWLVIRPVGNMTYVYESPDNGDTVYRRKVGETERELHSVSERRKNLINEIRENQLWGNIHRAALTNPTLQEALDRVKVIYYLSKENGHSKT